jgi:O-glycosyl hydrolase
MRNFSIIACLALCITFLGSTQISDNNDFNLQIDGSKKFQRIDGFGVNINSVFWYDGEYINPDILKPAIDMLVDSMGSDFFRVVVEEMDWEEVNDDNNPNNFNWTYYNKIFSNTKFNGVWSTLQYLNSKGVSDKLIISFMGAPPAAAPLTKRSKQKSWMGGFDNGVYPEMEDEFVESIAALLYYARHTAKIQFRLISPMNETDIISLTKSNKRPDGVVEGPNIPDAVQFTRIVKKLAKKLDNIGMDDIRFIAPDPGGDGLFKRCFDEMIKDPYIMSKLAYWGIHKYGNDVSNYNKIIQNSENPNRDYIVTETAGIENLFGQLDDDAQGYIFWDGFDSVYQHARRNSFGNEPPNDYLFDWGEPGKPLIEFISSTKTWKPRKQFFEFAQVFKFIKPGAVRIGTSHSDKIITYAFINPDGQLIVVGQNKLDYPIKVDGEINNLSNAGPFELFVTNTSNNLNKVAYIENNNNIFDVSIPANAVFTLSEVMTCQEVVKNNFTKPEPVGWYTGDMHVHRDCGGPEKDVLPETRLVDMMKENNLDIISVLADLGNSEVKFSKVDLLKVNGKDAPQSVPGRIVHWDAEWHWDPFGVTFDHKAVGGHIVLLGMDEARQIKEESTYKVLDYGRQHDAIVGFCHLQYLNDSIQNKLNCCIPIEHVSEIALGTVDFIAEDVYSNTLPNNGNYNADATINAFYKFLNCGFRLGLAAGTDYPCNSFEPFGALLTYVKVDGPLTYRKWVEGIRDGKTVITRNGHREFIDLKVNGQYQPGDEIKYEKNGSVEIEVKWTSIENLTGDLEIVYNGKVIASEASTSGPGSPVVLKTKLPISQSGWICARRMDENGHLAHTSPVYVTLNGNPVRASAADANFFVDWIDNLIEKTSPGGPWNQYYANDLKFAQDRYKKAKAIYLNIAKEAENLNNK